MNRLSATETSCTVMRALVHIAVGLAISVTAFFLPRGIMLLVLGLAALGVLLIDLIRLREPGFNAWFCRFLQPFLRDYEATRLLGASFLIVASLVVYTVFNLQIAVLAISFLAIGDPLARLVGERFGRWKLFRKNIEGLLACLIVCLATASIWRYAGLSVPLAVALTGAVGATIAESLPIAIDDNLTIPLLSGAMMWLVSFVA